ncbi:MAG: 3-hydroxyacyl-ACP dehydratase FabZ [Planctomycetes bacterium]|nr:3-hydroxyacyl-ACP dehydratase FabZ [Planctomycetota bacterium]
MFRHSFVIDGDSVEGNTLRFSDEPLRHKVLDLIGDLALLGAPVRGHIIGMCSGHRLNRQLAAKLADVARRVKRPKQGPSQSAAETLDVLRRIPHRAPFLFIDRIVRLEPNKRIVATKYVNPDESYFQGHFPARPIMPGVLVAESLLQATAALLYNSSDNPPTLAKIDSFRLRQPVLPGDELELEVEVLNVKRRWARVRGVARVRGQVVGEGRFTCVEMDLDKNLSQRSSGAAD